MTIFGTNIGRSNAYGFVLKINHDTLLKRCCSMLKVMSVETDCELPEETFLALSALVSPEKRKRINRLLHRQNAINMLMGDIIVRHMICAHTGLRNETLLFLTNQYEKPYLANVSDVHFNISHSGNIVVCALSDETVGIDIEMIKPAMLQIAKRFFSAGEYEFIEAKADKSLAFYKIWTMKESYVKWEGKGLSTPLKSFNVLELERQGRPFFHSIDISAGTYCYVCSDIERINSYKHNRLSDLLKSDYFSSLG